MSELTQCDVAVVGGGISGMIAALRCAQGGQRVVVLEQSSDDRYVCNSRLTAGIWHCCQMDIQSDPEILEQTIMQVTGGAARCSLARAVARDGIRVVRWMQQAGIRFIRGPYAYQSFMLSPPTITPQGRQWEGRGGDVMLRTFEAGLSKSGGAVRRGHEVKRLIVNAGTVTGLAGETHQGKQFEVAAAHVILADGGFQSSLEDLRGPVTPAPEKIFQRNARTGMGAGMCMAKQVGASVSDLRGFYGHVLSKDAFNSDKLWPYAWLDFVAAAGIAVGRDGRRFDDEGLGGVHLANAIAALPDPLAAMVIADQNNLGGAGHVQHPAAQPASGRRGGTMYKADSIEALAAQSGIDPVTLIGTVKAYNAAIKTNTAGQLQPARSMHKFVPYAIEKPPFYAFPACAGITYTMGGIVIDEGCRVLDDDGRAIPGSVCGGLYDGRPRRWREEGLCRRAGEVERDGLARSGADSRSAGMSALPLLTQVAKFAAGIRYAQIPQEVRRQAKLNVLDTIGCIASGVPLLESKMLLRAELAMGGKAEATVAGSRDKVSMRAAARINGYMGDVFELNDLIGGHASIATVTPALALAEAIGASPLRMLEASITGIEVVCRVHGGFYANQKPFTETGMAQVGIANAIGAAAAAAKLLDFDEDRTLNAMTVAGALAGWCPAEVVFGDGSLVKPMLFGAWPGSVGLMAASYAKEGITGSPRLLESDIGYYATVARGISADVVLNFDEWRLAQARRKLHACCGYTHSAIDLVAKLRRDGVALRDAKEIRVHTPAYILPAVSKCAPPTTGNEARFNLQYLLAHAAVDSDIILPGHSLDCERHVQRAEVEAMRRKFNVVIEPKYNHYRYSSIEVIDGSGRVLVRADNDAPRGSEWNPMNDDEVRSKFRRLTSGLLSEPRVDQYLERFEGIENEARVDWVLAGFDS